MTDNRERLRQEFRMRIATGVMETNAAHYMVNVEEMTPEEHLEKLKEILDSRANDMLVLVDEYVEQRIEEKAEQKLADGKKVKFCALGEYGIEYVADTEKEAQDWIDLEIKGEGNGTTPVDKDYYQIVTHTQAELDAMPED